MTLVDFVPWSHRGFDFLQASAFERKNSDD
jgi:hypothetical protein